MPKPADNGAEYQLDQADDDTTTETLPEPTDPSQIPPDEGDSGAHQ